jgi:hypothetical protein
MVNPQTRNKRISLDDRISNFIACAVDCGYSNRDSLTRKEVKSICEQTGIVYPRWLAKNPDRRICRGGYDFPELAAAGVSTPTVPEGHIEDDPQSDVELQAHEEIAI